MVRIRGGFAGALAWLAFAAFACRALAPIGYMPAPLGEGGPYVLCPSGAQAALVEFLAGSPTHHGAHSAHAGEAAQTGASHDGDDMRYCPLGTSVAAMAHSIVSVSPSHPGSDAVGIPVDAVPLPATSRSPYRSRAPPFFLVS